jgi:hypothetical protein
MKKTYLFAGLIAGASVLGGATASAQTNTLPGGVFTPGDIVVYTTDAGGTRGTGTLSSAGAAVYLDEYTPSVAALGSTLAGSYELPTTAGTVLPLVASGTAASEGLLNTSTNGEYVLVTGYDAAVGTAGVSSATSTAVPREVDTVSISGALASTTINGYSGNNIRSAASPDGTTIYTSGATTGVLAVTSGATNTAGTVVSSTYTNNTGIGIYNGQLYVSSAKSATYRIATVGTGVSSAAGQTTTTLPGIPISTTAGTPVDAPYQFVATTLTMGGTMTDTVYVADTGAGIEKFSLVSGNYTLEGTATLTNVTGLIGVTVGTVEDLYATTPTGLYSLVDASGAAGSLIATPTEIAAVTAGDDFRGLTFAPTAVVPEPSTWAVLGLGGFCVLTALRRRSV